MTTEMPHPLRVPTLTEVIEEIDLPRVVEPAGIAASESGEEAVDADTGRPALPAPLAPVVGPVAEDLLVQRVMGELQRQVDLMLEYRLRELLAPLLARAADNLVRDLRAELASTLRDVVARAVAQELGRHRGR